MGNGALDCVVGGGYHVGVAVEDAAWGEAVCVIECGVPLSFYGPEHVLRSM